MTSSKIRSTFMVALTFFLLTCADEEEVQTRSYPVIDTKEVGAIDQAGANLEGEVRSTGNSGILDHGFVYNDISNPELNKADRISLGERNSEGTFSALANRNLVKDKKYYVKAYAVTKENTVVYGQQMEFISQGGSSPTIQKVIPTAGVAGDTILLVGNSFSDNASNNVVLFGAEPAQVVKATSDSLWCVVPLNTIPGENRITFKLGQFNVIAEQIFVLNAMSMSDFTPATVTFGDTVAIQGVNFPLNEALIEVTFFGKEATIISLSSLMLKVIVPNTLTVSQSTITLLSGKQLVTSSNPIHLSKPVIDSFSPQQGIKDTEVVITGDYFNPVKSNNKVEMNGMELTVLEANRTTLKVRIPELPGGEYPFSVTITGQKVISTSSFELGPIIDSVTPIVASWNDEVVIKGRGFSPAKTDNMVKLGDSQCEVIAATETELVIKVPVSLLSAESTLSVKVPTNTYPYEFSQPFRLATPTITSVTPSGCKSGCIVEIYGTRFYPSVNQVVRFGEFEATIIEATANRIKVQLPTGLIDSQVTIEVTAGEVTTTSPATFHLISAWRKLKNIPQQSYKGFAFSAGSFGYVGFAINDDNTLWRYDINTDSWTTRSAIELPGENMVAFSNGTNGWAGMSERDKSSFMRYNVSSNTWSASAAFPGPPTARSTSFTIGDATYVTNGQGQFYFEGLGTAYIPTVLTYRYSMSVNTWTQMSNSPTFPVPEGTIGSGRMDATSFAIGNDGFVFGGSSTPDNVLGDLLIYHASGNTWESIPQSNVAPRHSAVSFAINGMGYLLSGYNANREVLDDCWSFNPSTRSWTQLEDFPGSPRGDAIVFVIGNKAYFGSGYDGNNSLDDFWEFDPSKL